MSDHFDLDRFLGLPRISGLAMSPDGERLVTTVAQPSPDGTRFRSAIWEVGMATPRRLTRSTPGESGAVFLPDGGLLFTSTRPDPDRKPADAPKDEPTGLWMLPADGGEARLVVAPGAGVTGVRTARRAQVAVILTALHPGARTLDADREREQARSNAGVRALLFESHPIRFWDHYLGPREPHLLLLDLSSGGDAPPTPIDLTPEPGRALDETGFDVLPDGSGVVTSWVTWPDLVHPVSDLVVIGRDGHRRTLTTDGAWYHEPAVSPDGRHVVAVRDDQPDPDRAFDSSLRLFDLEDETSTDLTPELDLWPGHPIWTPDGRHVVFTADRLGHVASFAVDVATREVRLLADEGAWSDVQVAPDGSRLVAIRSSYAEAPEVVELPLPDGITGRPGAARILPSPALDPAALGLPGTPERIVTRLPDGTEVASWLITPHGANAEVPAPLLLWIHGGPLSSWDAWHWRWNPHLLVARGYAVVLPDPALSTGYGLDFIRRGWGRWGEAPYTDLMAVMDDVVQRPDIDATRTAAMGGSFGGYMANWVAGHTDRFRAIVTHASLWDLRGFHGTTDWGPTMEAELGDPYTAPERWDANSPSAHVARIRTPMLVIHGELDHRVPISEGLRLWTDLQRHGVDARFLYFPDENHWVLKPANARLWYETVLAFLDQHVLGRPWVRPTLL